MLKKCIFQDCAVTVITIGEATAAHPASASHEDDACLPPVLQDRKRTPSASHLTGSGRITLTDVPDLPVSNPRKISGSNRPDVVATCAAVASKLAGKNTSKE